MKGQANAYSHTHCQTAQANPQTQVWQRVLIPTKLPILHPVIYQKLRFNHES